MIKKEEIKIAVIGLGYVGLPLALEFSKKFNVVGLDLSTKRNKAISGLPHGPYTVKNRNPVVDILYKCE